MFNYGTDNNRQIPFPCIVIRAKRPENPDISAQTEAIIDTGASMTCLPRKLIDALGRDNLVYDELAVAGVIGMQHMRSFVVDMEIAKCTFTRIEVIEIEKEFALIGRDILNNYILTFNGPGLTWSVDAQC